MSRDARDAVAAAAEGDVKAIEEKALAVHALAGAGLVDHRHRALLEHAGADSRQDVVAGGPIEDDVVDAGIGQ